MGLRNEGHEASCPQERCWAKAQRYELGGSRGQPGMAVPPAAKQRARSVVPTRKMLG